MHIHEIAFAQHTNSLLVVRRVVAQWVVGQYVAVVVRGPVVCDAGLLMRSYTAQSRI